MPDVLRAMIERAGALQTTESAPLSEEQDHCALCGLPIPGEHRHVLDLAQRELLCTCRACSLLFDHASAGGRHYRLIPDRCARLDGLRLNELEWRSLGIPVQMAFFVRDSGQDRVSAFYPSPAGATESTLPLEGWDHIEAQNPDLATLQTDVEALLVNRTGARTRAFIVGLDECYRLVAVVRQYWRGFSGGDEVWDQIAAFFDELDRRAQRKT